MSIFRSLTPLMRDRVSTSYLRARRVNASDSNPAMKAARRAGVARDYLLRFAMVSSLARELRVVPNSKL